MTVTNGRENGLSKHFFPLEFGIWNCFSGIPEKGKTMSCYFRHMKDILEEVNVEVTPDNKKEIDRILHGVVGVEYKNCSPAWKKIKEMIKGDEESREDFVIRLRKELD